MSSNAGAQLVVAQRLAAMVWRSLDGDEAAVVDWLCRLGCRLVEAPAGGRGAWILDGVTGIRCGLGYLDPPSGVPLLAMLLFGEHWPAVAGGAGKLVMEEWHRRRATEPLRGTGLAAAPGAAVPEQQQLSLFEAGEEVAVR